MLRCIGGLSLVVLAFCGCNRFDASRPPVFTPGPTTIGDGGVGVSSQIVIEHPLFAGISSMVAGDGVLRLDWKAADDDDTPREELGYRIYLAAGPGDQDFTGPSFVTGPGETSADIDGLTNGETLFAVVRAVDASGNEDPNVVEWMATPNPVRFIDAASVAPNPDGLTPATAFATFGQAVGASIPLGGVNFHAAAGSYVENIVLLPGMCAFGGFTPDFDVASRDPVANVTEVSTTLAVDLVALLPGAMLSCIDGVVLSGNDTAQTGVRADDAFVRITNCEIRDVTLHGIELFSDILDLDTVEGLVSGCSVLNCAGEGILIDGLTDLVIDDNVIRGNGNEGIESQWIYGAANLDTRIEITRNRIERNAEEGIDLDLAEVSELDPMASAGARVRVLVRNNLITRNGLDGVQIDVDFESSDAIDLRGRVEDNRVSANGGSGILIDGDAAASFRIARNAFTANAGFGVRVSGTIGAPIYRLQSNRILGNLGGGVRAADLAYVEIRHCILRGNAGPAIQGSRAFVDVVNSLVMENAGPFNVDRLRYSVLFDQEGSSASEVGVVAADPLLERHPLFVTSSLGTGSFGEILVPNPASWLAGDLAEVRDDGVPRVVVQVLGDGIFVDPAAVVVAGDGLFDHGGAETVDEAEGLLSGSPAIDAGNPLEEDRDGSLPDLGPIGGDTPGNVGIETGLALERAGIELIFSEPGAGFLLTEGTWSFAFNREVPEGFASRLRVRVNDVLEVQAPQVTVDGNHAEVSSSAAFVPGDRVTIEILPGQFTGDATDITPIGVDPGGTAPPPDGANPEQRQSSHLLIDYIAAAAAEDADSPGSDANGGVGSAQTLAATPALVQGAIDVAGDLDYYSFEIAAGEPLRAELVAGRNESSLIGRLTLFAADGVTILASSSALPPGTLDPVLPPYTSVAGETVFLLVESIDGGGSAAHAYELAIGN